MDIVSTIANGITALVNAVGAVVIGIILGLFIALLIGIIVLGIIRIRDRNKKYDEWSPKEPLNPKLMFSYIIRFYWFNLIISEDKWNQEIFVIILYIH